MIEVATLYDLLQLVDEADVYDAHYDDVICWCFDDDEDVCARCAMEMAKRIPACSWNRGSYGEVTAVADIGAFVKEHMQFCHELSQGFKWPMPDSDPENDESVFRGVQMVNAMQAGYACDEDYEAMLRELGAAE